MNLETRIKEQLKQFNENISIVEEQGPRYYHDSHRYGRTINISRPEEDPWKVLEAEVYNYLVAFKNIGFVPIEPLTFIELYPVIPIMEGFRQGIATQFKPRPVSSESLYALGPLKEEYTVRCGRLVFMEQVGERKISTQYTFSNESRSDIFGTGDEIIEPLFQVVKVTFCPTKKIAKAAAIKYSAQETGSIHVTPKDLGEEKVSNKKKSSFWHKLFPNK